MAYVANKQQQQQPSKFVGFNLNRRPNDCGVLKARACVRASEGMSACLIVIVRRFKTRNNIRWEWIQNENYRPRKLIEITLRMGWLRVEQAGLLWAGCHVKEATCCISLPFDQLTCSREWNSNQGGCDKREWRSGEEEKQPNGNHTKLDGEKEKEAKRLNMKKKQQTWES